MSTVKYTLIKMLPEVIDSLSNSYKSYRFITIDDKLIIVPFVNFPYLCRPAYHQLCRDLVLSMDDIIYRLATIERGDYYLENLTTEHRPVIVKVIGSIICERVLTPLCLNIHGLNGIIHRRNIIRLLESYFFDISKKHIDAIQLVDDRTQKDFYYITDDYVGSDGVCKNRRKYFVDNELSFLSQLLDHYAFEISLDR